MKILTVVLALLFSVAAHAQLVDGPVVQTGSGSFSACTLVGTCRDSAGSPVGAASSPSAARVLFSRDFRLAQSASSTPSLPTCLGTGDTTCMVCTPTGTTWACTWGDGATETVTQGTSPTAYTDPFGRNALDTVTNAKLPTITTGSARLIATFNGPHTVLVVGNARNTNGFGGVQPYWKWTSTGGTSEQVRGQNDFNSSTQTSIALAISGGPIIGWSLLGYTQSAQTGGTQSIYGDETNMLSGTATLTGSSAGALHFFQDCNPNCASGNVSTGSIDAIVVYSTSKSQAFVEAARRTAFGLVDDSASPIHLERNSRGWAPPWLTGNRAEPYGRGTPILTSRGLEIHPGSDGVRPQGNGWITDNTDTGNGHKGLDASTWTNVGTPTVNANVAAGYFGAWDSNSTTATEMDEIVDASASDAGKSGVQNCVDTPAAGIVNVGIVARTGTTGTTLDKMRLGIVTDGAVGAPCTTWQRVRDGAAVTTLTSTPEFYSCSFNVTGTPTFIRGEVLVGSTAADTGSIIVEAPTCSGTGQTPGTPLPDGVIISADVPWIDSAEVDTWPTGQSAGADIEVVFVTDYDLPGTPTNGGSYIFATSDGATAEIKLMMFETGASDGHAASDVYVRDGWRSTAFTATCANGAFGNNGTDITSPGSLGSFTAGTMLVERMRIVPAGTLSGVPRVNHFLYFDTCSNAATCHATTLRASNTSGTMCAGDATDTYAALGGRTSGPTPVGVNNNMSGAIVRFTVKEVH